MGINKLRRKGGGRGRRGMEGWGPTSSGGYGGFGVWVGGVGGGPMNTLGCCNDTACHGVDQVGYILLLVLLFCFTVLGTNRGPTDRVQHIKNT